MAGRIKRILNGWRQRRQVIKIARRGPKNINRLLDAISAESRISKVLPDFEKLRNDAWARLESSGKIRKYEQIDWDIDEGKIRWIPENRRFIATNYILIRMAGFEVSKEKIKALGLEKDAASLDKLIENY